MIKKYYAQQTRYNDQLQPGNGNNCYFKKVFALNAVFGGNQHKSKQGQRETCEKAYS